MRVIINMGGEMGIRLEYFTVGFAVLSATIFGAITLARADETPFASIYTAETEPQGEAEVEQWATWTRGKPNERFDQVLGRTEVEYGITNKLQLALYANYSRAKIAPHG